MSRRPQPRISVLVPARNEERTLPVTLPRILAAARALPHPSEVLVVTPPGSTMLTNPPVVDRILQWHVTLRPGKFQALRMAADASRGEVLVLVDADVLVEPEAFGLLTRPMFAAAADVVAGRITLLPRAADARTLLEQWSAISFDCWNRMRADHTDLLWALPGAIYAIRRDLLPEEPLVPIVDDASVGLYAKDMGSTFVYEPAATVATCAPTNYGHWVRQKLRSRRGWATLRQHRPDEVVELEATLRRYVAEAAERSRTGGIMQAQDRVLRGLARWLPTGESAGAWKPLRTGDQWASRW